MARITAKKSGMKIRSEFAGGAVSYQSQKAADFLRSVLSANFSECILDLSGVTEIDIPYLQMLIAFRRSMDSSGKRVSFVPLSASHPVSAFASGIGLGSIFAMERI